MKALYYKCIGTNVRVCVCISGTPTTPLLPEACIQRAAEATGVEGSGFNSPGFMRRLTGQPVRRATADLYSHDRGSATCGQAWNRCHTENGSLLL